MCTGESVHHPGEKKESLVRQQALKMISTPCLYIVVNIEVHENLSLSCPKTKMCIEQ